MVIRHSSSICLTGMIYGSNITETRERHFIAHSLHVLFEDPSVEIIFNYLETINLFGRI